MWVIGRAEDGKCECGVARNTIRLRQCALIGDGRGRTEEEAYR